MSMQITTPFMYAIADGEGSAYFEEGCVAPEAKDLQPEVDGLNSCLDEDEKPYRVVALYTHHEMTAQDRLSAIRTHHLRAGKIICMASVTSTLDEIGGEDLINDLVDDLTNRHPSVRPLQKAMAPLIDEGEDDIESLLAQLSSEGFHGYAIEFHAPANECGEEPIFDSYYTTWVYADTIDAAWQMGIEWAKEMKAKREKEQTA